MTTSIGNSKVYHFLARTQRNQDNDWQKYADKKYGNSDGIISYNEFVNFIKSEYSDVMNGDALSNADMNIFWNSVDTDKVEFSHRGNTVKGVNNLNATEFANMETDLNDYIDLETIYAQALKLNPFSANCSDKQFIDSWNNMVSTMLREELVAWQKAGRPEAKTFADYMSKKGRTEQVYKVATAHVAKDKRIAELKAGAFGKLAEMGYDIETDPNIQNIVNQYIANMPDFGDKPIAEVLQQVIKDVEAEIKTYLETVQKVNENGESIAPVGPNEQPTVAQIAALQVELEGKINQAVALLNSTIPNANKYPDVVQNFVEEYRLKLADRYKIETSEGYNALKNLTPVEICAEIKDPLKAAIDEAEAWANFENAIKTKINNGELTNAILGEVEAQELKDLITNGKFVEAIQSDILARVREFGTYADGKVDVDEAWAKILVEAKEQVATRVADNFQNGYTAAGVGEDTKENKVFSTYESVNILLNSFIADDAKRNEQYAKIALGYFKDASERGFADIVKDVVGVSVSALNVEDLAAEGKDKVSGWVAEVHTAILKKVAEDKKADDVDDVDDDDKVDGTDDYDYVSDDTTISSGVHKSHDPEAVKEAAIAEVNKLITKIADDMISEGLNERYVKAAMKSTQEYMTGLINKTGEKWYNKNLKDDFTRDIDEGVSFGKQTRANKKNLSLMPTFDTPIVLLENSGINNSYEYKINVEFVASKMEEFYNKAVAGDEEVIKNAPSQDEIDKTKAINEFTYSGEDYVTSGKDSSHSIATVKNNAIENVRSLIKNIKEAMKAEGLTNKLDDVEKAANAHMKTYINALQDKGGRNHEESFKIGDETVSWAKQSRDREKKLDLRPSAAYPVVLLENTMINNSFEILISTEYVVNLMKNLYAKYL